MIIQVIHRIRGRFRLIAGTTAIAVLAGCVLTQEKYQAGFIAFGGEDVYDTGTRVNMHPNAPSIVQRYKPSVPGRSGDARAASHEGIDVVGPRGSPVLSVAPGTVISSYREPMYGHRVVIDHGPLEDGRRVITRYFHLKKRLVEKGDELSRGMLIGQLGASGMLAPNLHLHFEVQFKDPETGKLSPDNPHFHWFDGIGQVTCFDKKRSYDGDGFRMTYPAPCEGIPWQ